MTTQALHFTARQYRYANGGVYNPRHYTIWLDGRAIGGALVTRSGKTIAWQGMIGLTNIKHIELEDFFVWGNDLRAALAAFREMYVAFNGEKENEAFQAASLVEDAAWYSRKGL